MGPAQQHQVVDIRTPAVGPGADMVGLALSGRGVAEQAAPVPERQRPPLGGARQPHRSPQSQGQKLCRSESGPDPSGLSSVIDEHPGEFSGAQGESQGSVAEGGGAAAARRQRPPMGRGGDDVGSGGRGRTFPSLSHSLRLGKTDGDRRRHRKAIGGGRQVPVRRRAIHERDQGVGPALCVGQAVPFDAQGLAQRVEDGDQGLALHLGEIGGDEDHAPVAAVGDPSPIPVVLFRVLGVLGAQQVECMANGDAGGADAEPGKPWREDVEQGGHLAVGQAVRRRGDHAQVFGRHQTVDPEPAQLREAASQPGSGHETVRRAATPGGVPSENRRRGVGEYVRRLGHDHPITKNGIQQMADPTQGDHVVMEDGSGPQRRGDFATRQVRQPVGYGPDLVRAFAEPRQKSTSPPNAFAPAGVLTELGTLSHGRTASMTKAGRFPGRSTLDATTDRCFELMFDYDPRVRQPASTAAAGPVRLSDPSGSVFEVREDRGNVGPNVGANVGPNVGLCNRRTGNVRSRKGRIMDLFGHPNPEPPRYRDEALDRTQPPPDWWIHLVEVELGPLAEHEIEALWDLALM